MTWDFHKQFINGEWVPSTGEGRIKVVNPATLEAFEWVPDGTYEDADRAVAAARAAAPGWAATPRARRVELMKAMLVHLRAMADDIVALEMKELGSPEFFARATHCNYQYERIESYISIAEKLELESEYAQSLVIREPVGVVACITPWNYPLGQVVQKVIPAILMGNTVVLKPSQHTPLTACLLMEAFRLAGFPAGVVNMTSGRGSRLGDRLATNPEVDMVSFTGSTKVGIALSQKALESMKRISLELGGKSPYVWLPGMDDYRPAVEKLFASVFLNSGQTCTALSRLILPESMKDEAISLIREALPCYPVGDPADSKVKIGPVASRAQYDKVRSYIELGLAEGATMVAGSVPAAEPAGGYYIEPVVFSDVDNKMRIAQEEIFGPVLCIITYKTLDEAIAIANDTPYGLNAAVYGPKEQAIEVARAIKAGNVYVNDGPRDVSAPFGGYKASGIGREGGAAGLYEFTQYKAIFEHGAY